MIVEVALPISIDKTLYYSVEGDMQLELGDYVMVPLSNRQAVGLVVDIKNEIDPEMELKSVINKLCIPAMQVSLIRFIQWVSSYNIIPMGMVLKMVFGGMPRGKFLSPGYLQEASVCSEYDSSLECTLPELSAEQDAACNSIIEKGRGFSVTVLDGKTGSGKTEVYCTAAKRYLHEHNGAQILVLLPEIVLATQLMKRINGYFANYHPVEWHSGLTVKRRRENWVSAACGTTSIVVGARSALFLPFKNLRMIIVDEEHESSYKQDYGMIYNARDMAIVLAKQADIPVILCSATPALETMYNVLQGKYHHVILQRRFGTAVMPDIVVADMRKDTLKKSWLSTCLHDKILATLKKGQQVMLFLNRRGYARLVLCKKCGHKINCPNCCTWLAEHRMLGMLMCHYCAHTCVASKQCSNCKEHNTMIAYGVGIERIAEGIAELIPEARTAIMSSDLSVRDANNVMEQALTGNIDIIIGTQMIAKGHNFPKLTLVGVIDADLGLGNSDLRAAEKTYQLLQQVSGRSGRYEEKGEVVLQTYDPENSIIRSLLSNNREDFYSVELESRKNAEMPPYTRLVSIIVSGNDEHRVLEAANCIATRIAGKITVWGPAPASLSFINNMYRYRILLKVHNVASLRGFLTKCRDTYKKSRFVRIAVDVDPMNFA